MSKRLVGRISESQGYFQIEVPLILFEEDELFYAHIPPLDITGYGKTEQEATESLEVMLDEFFSYTTKNHSLEKVLKKLGWKKKPTVKYPSISDMISQNELLKETIDNRRSRIERKNIKMPMFA